MLWLVFMGVLKVYVDATESFGSTYGPVAGTIGLLLWAFLTSVALFGGLAFVGSAGGGARRRARTADARTVSRPMTAPTNGNDPPMAGRFRGRSDAYVIC